MKKIYLPLVAITTLLAFSITVVAQRPKNLFNSNSSSAWNTGANWSLGRIPQTGDSIVITSTVNGSTAYIGPNSSGGGSTTTVTLSDVIVVVQAGTSLQLGNGHNGANDYNGVLALDNASAVSIEGSGASAGQIVANQAISANQITLGGVVKFQGNLNYSSTNTGSGTGLVKGPARATSATGSGAQGFIAGSLPVVLVGFSANLASNDKVSVKWTTQQEISTDHFEIQRSSDGMNWQTIATVKASGYSSVQTSYSIEDGAPLSGTNLYRLRMFDFDSHSGFSSVVNVHLNALGKMTVYPNPSVNTITVSLGHVPAGDWTLSLVNINGQLIVNKKFSKEVTTVSLPVINYPNGNYSVEITDGISHQSSKLLIAHK